MIAAKTWREIRWMAIAYTLILEALLIPAILLWPTLRNEAAALGRIIPIQTFKQMFADISSDTDAAYGAYMAVQMFFKGTNIVGIACAVLLGTGMIARERENQTLEFLLARPVSRSRVLAGKFLVCAAAVAVPIWLTSWSAIPLSRAIGEQLSFAAVTVAATHAALFVLGFLALTCICSVLSRTQVHAAFAIGAFVIVQVAIYFIQEIRVASIFMQSDYAIYGPVMAGNLPFVELLWRSTLWIVAAAAACYAVADRLFRRIEP
jgi:ABC-2 type transport system permease protein